jgi:hypothetical protein
LRCHSNDSAALRRKSNHRLKSVLAKRSGNFRFWQLRYADWKIESERHTVDMTQVTPNGLSERCFDALS